MRKVDFDLLDLKLKFNDPSTKQKVKRYKHLLLLLATVILLVIINPLSKLKETFEYKMANPREIKLYPTYKNETKTSSSKYIYPTNGQVTSEYGYRQKPYSGFHTGIDISCFNHRDNILAVADGTVTFAGSQEGYGYCVEIKHEFENETVYSFYAHLSSLNVYEGKKVSQGDVIGNEGGDPYSDPNPGNSTGHHLHFELRNAPGYGNDIYPDLGL